MESFKNTRRTAKAVFTRVSNWLQENRLVERRVNAYLLRETQLCDAYNKYINAQNEIENLDTEGIDIEDRGVIEDRYFDTLTEIKTIIDTLNSENSTRINSPSLVTQQSMQTATTQNVKLPEINIPIFSGDITQWESFYQLYSALIHNNESLTDIQKFIYLKSFLKAEPFSIINTLPLTSENYTIALTILVERYQNNLAVINSLINTIIDYLKLVKITAKSLREFITICKSNLESLKTQKCPVNQWDLLLLNILERKLDFNTKRAFESERDINNLPTIAQFFTFLEKRCKILENISSSEQLPQKPVTVSRIPNKAVHFTQNKPIQVTKLKSSVINNSQKTDITNGFNLKCIYCGINGHRIYSCNTFKNMAHADKVGWVNVKKVCFNCLGDKHISKNCTSGGCSICSRRHHTLLHVNPIYQTSDSCSSDDSNVVKSLCTSQPIPSHSNATISKQGVSAQCTSTIEIILATAMVTLIDNKNNKIQARALLDSGSQNSFITNSLVTKLNLTPYEQSIEISGIANKTTTINKMIDITIHSNVHYKKHFKISCAILNKITTKLPQTYISPNILHIPKEFQLADPKYFVPSEIDLLIGAELFYDLLTHGNHTLGDNKPCLQNTWLGWTISGKILSKNYPSRASSTNHHSITTVALLSHLTVTNDVLNKSLERFWEIENIPEIESIKPDEELAEQWFIATTKILPCGSFQVDIPLLTSKEQYKLGNSFHMAKKRFNNLEKRFKNDENLFKDYKNFINEYLDLKHGRIIPLELQTIDNCNKYFLPHHCVIKKSSSTTKLRVVFDGSAKTSTGLSLNDITLKGFQVQPDLYDILCRFRTFKYALTTDIKKMFRQVKVNPKQTYLQNILWRDHPEDPLYCIELNTVTYGTKSAPFLATRVLKELADKNVNEYPLAARALYEQCYVDDILSGTNSLITLNTLYHKLTTVLNSANFELHKWSSNNDQFLNNLNILPSSNKVLNMSDTTHSSKVLGLSWNYKFDAFSISIPIHAIKQNYTKREVLSLLSQMFDPLGFIGPVLVIGKIIIQQIWLKQIGWDDNIDKTLYDRWISLISNISTLRNLTIPRYIFDKKEIKHVELHIFADASMKAYAACVYIRAIYEDNTVTVTLVTAKTKVTPIKTLTIPKLELCAMHLAAKLTHKVITILKNNIKIDSIHFWSDSEIALCWISCHPSRSSVFVANRVNQIQELTKGYSWNHVKSGDNPADLGSRGILPQDLLKSQLWWHGPAFLHDYNFVKNKPDKEFVIDNPPEQRKVSGISIPTSKNLFWINLFAKFSNYTKLQRIIAYTLRFVNNCIKDCVKINDNTLSVTELELANNRIILEVQLAAFNKEIQELKNNKQISNKQLMPLNPFLDESNFLCIGGRLENADLPFRQRHPILLPDKTHITDLLIILYHTKLGHAGPHSVLYNMRIKYWPLNGLRRIKTIIHKCVTCYRFRPRTCQQIMSNLPKIRITVSRPFSNVGIDFGGPFTLKSSKLRKAPSEKAYIATKAIHIELVSSLSTDAFLMTLKRFISRRGCPTIIYTDNATSFVGSRNKLLDLHKFFINTENAKRISEYLSLQSTQWKFIPPRSPHWGGIWEAAIKSTKYHLYHMTRDSIFTYEELNTILVQIEAILNSRPLCPLSTDPSESSALTPGHFLIGSPLTALPEPDVSHEPVNRLSQYQKFTQIIQSFWKKWSHDYLNQLQHRPKWHSVTPNLKQNDLVIVKEPNTPPLTWPLARVVDTLPGVDGKVRAVSIKTQNGIFTRPITKICLLPISSTETNYNI